MAACQLPMVQTIGWFVAEVLLGEDASLQSASIQTILFGDSYSGDDPKKQICRIRGNENHSSQR